MAFSRDTRLCVIILFLIYSALVVSQNTPRTPETYYALVSETARIPCVAGQPTDRLRWSTENADTILKSRTTSYVDSNDPELFFNEISNVQPSDAGRFVCSNGIGTSSTVLVVIEPGRVQNVAASTRVPDEIKVTWTPPADNRDLVRSYHIYATEVGQAGKEVKIKVNDVSPDGREEYTLSDFIPGSTYEIQVAPLYIHGPEEVGEVEEGPRSPKVKIKTPKFEPVPWKVKAEPWYNSTILVTWSPPRQEDSRGVDGYTVYYKIVGKKGPPLGEVTVTRPDATRGWSAVLKGLKIKNKYHVHVVPFTGGPRKIPGHKSQEVLVVHNGFLPELSVRAIPVSPDTVLVTVDTVGGDKVDKLRILYSDDSAIKWTRVNKYNSQEKYALVTGLQPRTRYFFNVKATVNKKSRSVVTHVLTPPTGLSVATNISVTANSDSSVLLTWNYDGHVPAKGFIVLTENLHPDGSVRPVKQNVVFKQNEAVVDGLESGDKYQVKVEPFDLENIGTCSDPVLFQLNVAGDATPPDPERSPLQFVDQPPQELQINTGDDVRLTCTAIGVPHPMVQWSKDNVTHGKPADRVNEIVLTSVQGTTLLRCTASNGFETIVSQTHVLVTPEIDPQAPSFNGSLPETQLVGQGDDVRLWCSTTGSPVPLVSWFKDGVLVVSAAGSAEFVESRASRHFDLKCVARNDFGSIEAATKVYIKDALRNPSIITHLPSTFERYEGEQLVIPCSFDGDPTPVVTWFNGDTRLGDPASAQNSLNIDSVKSSANFTCRGENLLGRADVNVELLVIPRGQTTEEPENHDYVITTKISKKTSNSVDIRWAVDRGNLENIEGFLVTIKGESGNILLNATLDKKQRYVTVQPLSPNTRYTVNVKAFGAQGDLVQSADVSFVTDQADALPDVSNPALVLEANEVRHNSTRIDWTAVSTQPGLVKRYRLTILDTGPGGDNLLTIPIEPASESMTLTPLQPNERYHVIVEALAEDESVLMTSSLTFQTPSENQYGVPVSASSRARLQHSPVVKQLSKSAQQGHHQGKAGTSSDPVLELKVNPVSTSSFRLAWSLQNMPAGLVDGYILKLMKNGPQGNVILNRTLNLPETDFKIDGLSRNRHYFLQLDAVSQSGSVVLSASTLYIPGRNVTPFHVPSKLSDSGLSQLQSREVERQPDDDDGSKPEIDLDLYPLDHNQVRISWTVINENRRRPVASYKVRVHQDGPEGRKLHENQLAKNTQYYTVYDLLENTRYYIQLEALDKDGRVIGHVGHPYLVPPPGHTVEPIRTSSVLNKIVVTTTVSPAKQDRLSERDELVISRLEAQGSNSIVVEWNHAQADAGTPGLETFVRYAESSAKARGPFKIETVPAGQQRLVIRHLKPDTTYSIQLVTKGTDGRQGRWSAPVRRKTGPV